MLKDIKFPFLTTKIGKLMAVALTLVFIGSVGLDQVSKRHAHEVLKTWESKTDIRQFRTNSYHVFTLGQLTTPEGKPGQFFRFKFQYQRNTGPAFNMLADLRDRIPSTLQIKKIAQTPSGGASQGNAATPSSGASSNLTLSGSAISFGDVNDFVLTLRQSNYLSQDASNTKLKDATRKESKDKTSLVNYEISTQVNDAPADSLLTALKLNGASGLVSRIETLKRQGVIKP